MRAIMSVLAVAFPAVLLLAQGECVKGDCTNGYGTFEFSSGARYVGDFQNGKIHGQGILYFSDGNKYIGNWINQYREGGGRMIFTSGDEYVGEFRQNKFHGQGTMTYVSGNRYEGSWENNRSNGKGIFFFANGDRYEGNFKDGRFYGEGRMYYSDGSRYEGAWQDNLRHGKGALFLGNGEVIRGQWENDQYKASGFGEVANAGDTTYWKNCNSAFCASGKGKFAYPNGARYYGDFANGAPEGEGTVYYTNGDRYEGGWKNHAPHGRGIMYYQSGRTIGAVWDFGKPSQKLFTEEKTAKSSVAGANFDPQVKIWAVIVGAARYTHMPTLRYTDDDAYQVFAFLKSPEGGALHDSQLRLLIDEDATRQNILSAMGAVFSKADENDVILFYFSGHGLQGAFLPVDYDGYVNLLEHDEIKQMLNTSRAKHKLVIADACHSGSLLAFREPLHTLLQKYYKAFEEARGGTALLMSSKGEEYSLEDGGLRSGIFSHFLIKGLKGEADQNNDQIVTIQELFNFVHQNVRKYTGNVQTPTLSGSFDATMPVAIVR